MIYAGAGAEVLAPSPHLTEGQWKQNVKIGYNRSTAKENKTVCERWCLSADVFNGI